MEAHRVVRRRGSHIFYTISSKMAVRLSALRAGRTFSPQESWYSFLLEVVSTQGHSAAGRITSTEKSNCVIENQTRDLRITI
jgi:hypothetical protein